MLVGANRNYTHNPPRFGVGHLLSIGAMIRSRPHDRVLNRSDRRRRSLLRLELRQLPHREDGSRDEDNALAACISNGNLYGVTVGCGAFGPLGALYQLSPKVEFTLLHSFNGQDGWNPLDEVLWTNKGTLFDTTYTGGSKWRWHNIVLCPLDYSRKRSARVSCREIPCALIILVRRCSISCPAPLLGLVLRQITRPAAVTSGFLLLGDNCRPSNLLAFR